MGIMVTETQRKTEMCVRMYTLSAGKLGEIFAFSRGLDELISPMVFYHFHHFFQAKISDAGLSSRLKHPLRKVIRILIQEERSRDRPDYLEHEIVVDDLILRYNYRTVSATRFV
ncbi:hypothetical protein PP187_gp293 [Klebsiella phage vB_KvM-Eowyn]|uniref:Uncharacterized protein n=1 Tax=Klebsiella phage vB_KvM-Eowyn TaxID=2762819 RepID=A0A7R8MJV1_9CAUD|nr:hypothetical protein PP187_gp293 [Klebsiella phage vB_KvM-Eowyn]CAD5236282.1 hypothetical protein LLCLJKAH_00293 [Klebsiella phage vB_KvM-Eowyn]